MTRGAGDYGGGSAHVGLVLPGPTGRWVLDGERHSGVAAGALFTPDRWDDAGDRVDLDAAAGLRQLTVSGT